MERTCLTIWGTIELHGMWDDDGEEGEGGDEVGDGEGSSY